MAKRKKLEAPSAADLSRIEEEFRSETRAANPIGQPSAAPIAKVAADAAAMSSPLSPALRAKQAKLENDAAKLAKAAADGLLLAELLLAEIDADVMIRDRCDLNEDEMLELRQSIAAHGLRLPVEVYELAEPRADGVRYGLISGYRRIVAVRGLLELTEARKYLSIRAIIRPRGESDESFIAMVEENEVRSELSQFERGRIAAISTQQGAFVNVEDAVNKLFATGSKAKRSKVRSFALIFEELGDILSFPEALTEKRGLRLAQALRGGYETRLREALAEALAVDADAEWLVLDSVVSAAEQGPRDVRRGGRPKKASVSAWQNAETLETSAGVTIRKKRDGQGYLLRFEGKGLDSDIMDSLMIEIQTLLERS